MGANCGNTGLANSDASWSIMRICFRLMRLLLSRLFEIALWNIYEIHANYGMLSEAAKLHMPKSLFCPLVF
jgi:hypothetical protein